jgi:acyl-CoA thioester hydrolase
VSEGDALSELPVLYRTPVRPEWVDYNGHLSEAFYVLIFGYTTDALLDLIGLEAARREATDRSIYTLEAHINYLAEVAEGVPLAVATQVLAVDDKRAHVSHRMIREDDGALVATIELLLCHVDTAAGRSAPFSEDIAAELAELCEQHRRVPVDERVGRSIGLPERSG